MKSEVRAVGGEAFEEVYPLLRGFPTKGMSKEDWRRMLFAHRWSDNPQRGYVLYVGGKAVGFLGTIFSERPLGGRVEPVCNLSSWIVLPEHRESSLMLVTPVLRLRDYTIVNPTPSPVAYEIFHQLRFQPLESERLVLPPLPGVVEAARCLAGSFDVEPETLRRELTGTERAMFDDLSSCAVARHVLLRGRSGRRCYVVATPVHRRGLPFAEVQYIGDVDFFWKHRMLAHAAVFASTGALGLWVDRRFAANGAAPFAFRRPARRLFRPSRPDIKPEMIDGLYSELMDLRW